MGDRWAVLGAVAVIAATAIVTVARAGQSVDRFPLAPNAPGVNATASLTKTSLSVNATGLAPHAHVVAAIDRLACAARSYGRRVVGAAVADSGGAARIASAHPVGAAQLDGWHVIVLSVAEKVIACAPLAAADGSPPAAPATRSHWGIWTFAHHFID